MPTISQAPDTAFREDNQGQAVLKNIQVRRHKKYESLRANCMTDTANIVYCEH